MSHKIIENINLIENEIRLKNKESKIIAVSKTFSMENIKPLIDHGHIHFGENKVQEAVDKWAEIKKNFQNLKLHMIGKLQTNKVKNAVALFDYIHSLDSLKLAEKISSEQNKISKKIKLFIQVNIGAENQKSGIEVEQLKNFYEKCINDFDLNIIGLMCIPPITDNVQDFFIKMSKLNSSLNLSELSMGMSSDYIDAVNNGSTFVRIGSKIFGKRS
jgi:pyridoxal phosphate enzyme (YggS family)